MKSKKIYIVQVPQGFAIKRDGAERASAILPTQKEAIERAKEMNPSVSPHVERVKNTNHGRRDKWRKV